MTAILPGEMRAPAPESLEQCIRAWARERLVSDWPEPLGAWSVLAWEVRGWPYAYPRDARVYVTIDGDDTVDVITRRVVDGAYVDEPRTGDTIADTAAELVGIGLRRWREIESEQD